MDRFVEVLEERRQRADRSAREFADLIGVSESTYSRVRGGKILPGRRFIHGAIRAFPELAVVLAMEERQNDPVPERVAV